VSSARTLIDTNIAISMANGDDAVITRVSTLPRPPLMSIVSQVELVGILSDAAAEETHRHRVEAILQRVEMLPFTSKEADAYGDIIRHLGFSRRLIVDRMIAAQALVARATLATLHRRDFEAISNLVVEDWTGR
jgi:tRNA(fMet)-specific endonuclease VapC